VVSNTALDLGRQRGRRETVSLDQTGRDDLDGSLTQDDTDPGQGLEREDLRHLLNEALATLSEAHRKTFVLHVDGGLSYREVAEALGISIGTVMSRLYYARQKLRGFLTERMP
jgi:RNA polymerase sigma-70 factor (ECF subfamily)